MDPAAIDQTIANYARLKKTELPAYAALLEARSGRARSASNGRATTSSRPRRSAASSPMGSWRRRTA
jgi:hypothetical protein